MSDIESRTRTVVAQTLNLSNWIVTPDATLEKLGADSFDAIGLVMAVEREFGCSLPDDVFSALDDKKAKMTLQDLAGQIEEALKR
ncbi:MULTISPECIES: acyl carrier protein [Stappiaceae]|uniref:acyl carrier protein n=1 Tax=Stappiaceae TaxID=2821832 RepID=UPI000B8C1B75|nr:phosphopantetheine-binding protein [Labrenzia sp. VG12]ASP32946.1 acyl carrier protein [Labrenzia sp. VG12]